MSCLWMSCVVHVVNVTVICLYCEYICMYRSLDWTYCWITDYTSFPYWFYILFLHSFICTSLHIYIGYYSCHIIDHSFACHVIIVRLSISISLSILLSQMYSIFLSLGWEHLLHLMSVCSCFSLLDICAYAWWSVCLTGMWCCIVSWTLCKWCLCMHWFLRFECM